MKEGDRIIWTNESGEHAATIEHVYTGRLEAFVRFDSPVSFPHRGRHAYAVIVVDDSVRAEA